MSPLGRPVELVRTGGQAAAIEQAGALSGGHQPRAVTADAGYDSDAPVAAVEFFIDDGDRVPHPGCDAQPEQPAAAVRPGVGRMILELVVGWDAQSPP